MDEPDPRTRQGRSASGGPERTGFLERQRSRGSRAQGGEASEHGGEKTWPRRFRKGPVSPLGLTPRAGEWTCDNRGDSAASAGAKLSQRHAKYPLNKPSSRVNTESVHWRRSTDEHFRTTESYEIGAGWMRKGETSGKEYVSLRLAAPEFGPRKLYANLAAPPARTMMMCSP